jgi:hypothetical protein
MELNNSQPMRFYVTEQLSENISLLPSGFLLCQNVPITRIGEFIYRPNEVPIEGTVDGVVKIMRDEAEVFSESAINSFNGVPVTIEHPTEFVGPDNWNKLAVGTVQNVRRGDNGQSDFLMADLLITNAKAIELINAGQREISCGYDAQYCQLEPGIGKQTEIIGNHVAIVDRGRAGGKCAIQDKACDGCGECTGNCKNKDKNKQEEEMTLKEKVKKWLDSFPIRDADMEETEEEKKAREEKEAKDKKACDEAAEAEQKEKEEKEKKEAEDKKTKDGDDRLEALEKDVAEIKSLLKELLSEEATEDEEPETKEEKKEEAEEKKEAEDKKTKDEEEEAKKEEEKEKKETEDSWNDIVSHSDILVPGISLNKPTKDHRKTTDAIKADVLEKALNSNLRDVLAPILVGKDLKKMTTDTLDAIFKASSQIVTVKRNSSLVGGKQPKAFATTDGGASAKVREIQKANKDFYKKA